MACLDHECIACGFAWMDNHYAAGCPRCGERVTNDFDEPLHEMHDDDREPDCDAPLDGDDDDP